MAGSCQKTETNEKQSSHNTDNEVMWEDSFTGVSFGFVLSRYNRYSVFTHCFRKRESAV